MNSATHDDGFEAKPGDSGFPWRSSLLIFAMAMVVGVAAGAASGSGLYWLIEPDCSVSREFLCGLGEVLVSIAVAGVVGLAGFVWTSVRQVRRRVPPPQRQAALIAILAGPVGLGALFLMILGLGF